MQLDWSKLRVLNQSQHSAFEILCCQLADTEATADDAKLIRKAAPDGGVECFYAYADGSERAFQAKFFRDVPDESQWKQLDKSVQRALKTHPLLARYVICLPRDREDPRVPGQQWFMDNWKAREAKWETWARDAGRDVKFEYWGEHEIVSLLSRDEHRGRRFFWFDEEAFTQAWFEERLAVAVADAGARYKSPLNIDLPIAQVFFGLGRDASFQARLTQFRSDLRRAARGVSQPPESFKDDVLRIRQLLEDIACDVETAEGDLVSPIDFSGWGEKAATAADLASNLARKRDEAMGTKDHAESFPQNLSHSLRELKRTAEAVLDFLDSDQARSANACALLIQGEFGTGKTHLLCDATTARVKAGLPSVVLLGGQFGAGEPWRQAIGLLGLSCTPSEFLGALEAAADAADGRVIVAIDALNESTDRSIWPSHLAGMLVTLRKYPRVRLVLSVRTPYERETIPEQLSPPDLLRVTHDGFRGAEYRATESFFAFYGIKRPAVPLLNPEFENPLFLKLICEGLQKAGKREIPAGFHGISTIFNFLIDATNERISDRKRVDFDRAEQFVQHAIDALADRMTDDNVRSLPRDVARSIVDSVLPRNGYEHSLFRALLVENVLAEDRLWNPETDESTDVVRFTYDRLTDHLLAKRLLDRHLTSQNVTYAFASSQPLERVVRNAINSYSRGLVTAIAIQLPERVGVELPEVLPDVSSDSVMRHAFVESLLWRLPSSFTPQVESLLNDHVLRYRDSFEAFLEVLLTVATQQGHPFGADFLHEWLLLQPMAQRDSWWSTFLYRACGTHGAVDRLVEWGRSREDKTDFDDESILRATITLAWFLSTSHRGLRDDATKALVGLLTPRLHLVLPLLNAFATVNDPYIAERLYAVAYGSVMRSTDSQGIRNVAQHVYERVFQNRRPPAHLLLRDYARGIVELALARELPLEDVVRARIRPPYLSSWPKIPSEEDIAPYTMRPDKRDDREWARIAIVHSVLEFGDFARYIIGTNSGHFEWSGVRLRAGAQTAPEQIRSFMKSLTVRQRVAVERVKTARFAPRISIDRTEDPLTIEFRRTPRDAVELQHAEHAMRRALGKRKSVLFDALPRSDSARDEPRFDLRLAQRWVLKRVFDLGWTTERFGDFDYFVGQGSGYSRYDHNGERIGKKYQWIAWHEFVAYVTDNFRFEGNLGERDQKYHGPWQLYRRDHDPSVLLRRTLNDTDEPLDNVWWAPARFNRWRDPKKTSDWIRYSDDSPSVPSLIEVTMPDGRRALVLDSFIKWEEPTSPELDKSEAARRTLWYSIKSYLVPADAIDSIFAWASGTDLYENRQIESHHATQVFLGEFYWAPAYRSQRMEEDRPRRSRRPPHAFALTDDQYSWEDAGYDSSIDTSINIILPSRRLAEILTLQWRGDDGRFYDSSGRLTALDPSVEIAGPGALVLDRIALLTGLRAHSYDLLWIVIGERQDHPANSFTGGMSMGTFSGAFRLDANGKIVGSLKGGRADR